MATIIQEPGEREVIHHDHVVSEPSSGMGAIIGIIIAIVILAALVIYGLPLMRRAANRGASGTINVNVQGLPSGDSNPAQ